MHKNGSVILLTALLTLLLIGALGWLADDQGWIHITTPSVTGRDKELDSPTSKIGKLPENFICEVTVSMPQGALNSEPKVYTDMLIVGLDLQAKAGWYQGEYSISESRKGALRMEGNKAFVSRPAMFERFGQMITQEEFSLDLNNGSFVQTLTFKGGNQRHMIKGICAKYAKAPFQ
ncbi:MAG: hypothetical protein WBI20_11060 [Burkholderiaceae bacterium]